MQDQNKLSNLFNRYEFKEQLTMMIYDDYSFR